MTMKTSTQLISLVLLAAAASCSKYTVQNKDGTIVNYSIHQAR